MAISEEEIKWLARLSKLDFEEGELESFTRGLDEIIGFADRINSDVAGDTQSIREVEGECDALSALRPDVVTPSSPNEEITSNAVSERGCFSVRRVVK